MTEVCTQTTDWGGIIVISVMFIFSAFIVWVVARGDR